MRFSESPIVYERAAPTLGQHTDDVLTRVLGMSEEEINVLKGRKVL
jgi:crotonobetainyl-CoA:carnitine CoA-transferase CaiB-like acyl-CoA transferase